MNAPQVKPQRVQKVTKQHPAAARVVVARRVVAIAWMASRHQHSVSTNLKSLNQQVEIDPPSARQPDNADVRGVFQARGAGEVRP